MYLYTLSTVVHTNQEVVRVASLSNICRTTVRKVTSTSTGIYETEFFVVERPHDVVFKGALV